MAGRSAADVTIIVPVNLIVGDTDEKGTGPQTTGS